MGMGRYAATRFTPIPSLPLPLKGRELWLFLMKNGVSSKLLAQDKKKAGASPAFLRLPQVDLELEHATD